MAGHFILPDKFGYIREPCLIISNSNFTNCYFTSKHAYNYLPIKAYLPPGERKDSESSRFGYRIEKCKSYKNGMLTRFII